MQFENRKSCKAGSIYRTQSLSKTQSTSSNHQNQQNEKYTRKSSYGIIITNNTIKNNTKQSQVFSGYSKTNIINKESQLFCMYPKTTYYDMNASRIMKQIKNEGYRKDKINLRNTLVSQMKSKDLNTHCKSVKLRIFQEQYQNILENYQKKKLELNQQLKKGSQRTGQSKLFNTEKIFIKKSIGLGQNIKNQQINKKILIKKVQDRKIEQKNCLKHFYQALAKQIKLQKQLRSLKMLINKHNQRQEIYSILALRGYSKQQMKLVSEEYDPFEEQDISKDTESIVMNYIMLKNSCEQNWNKEIKQKWDQQQMKTLFERINFNKKSELNLKDFVIEINCDSGQHYRARDLYQIYKRLIPLNLDNFVRKLSTKS